MACILIVDDDGDTRDALKTLLEEEGFTIREAADGLAAIDQVTRPDAPALVLLDTRMANVDGLQFLDWIEGRPKLDGILIVLLSGDSAPLEHRRASAVLRKPFDIETLLGLVKKFSGPT